jgi:hypothetical protein
VGCLLAARTITGFNGKIDGKTMGKMGKTMDKWRFIAGKIIELNGDFSTFDYQRGCVNRFL